MAVGRHGHTAQKEIDTAEFWHTAGVKSPSGINIA